MIERILRRGHPTGHHRNGITWEIRYPGKGQHARPSLVASLLDSLLVLFTPVNVMGLR